MPKDVRSTQMLASVTSVAEALLVLKLGVDIIDLKNPAQGALGALPLNIVREVVQAINHQSVVSATIGDLPMEPNMIVSAVEAMFTTGVDIVKIGFFGQSNHAPCLHALKPLAEKHKLIAVLFADETPNVSLLANIADAGFYGVMLDTAKKDGRGLLDYLPSEALKRFVSSAKQFNLQSGLAGTLKADNVTPLLAMQPNYLGFRGALCVAEDRRFALDIKKVMTIKTLVNGF